MKLKMAENSLFAILLRKPWWISILIAVAVALAAAALAPKTFALFAATAGFPFLVIGIIAAYKQFKEPSTAEVERIVRIAGIMSWRDFSDALEQAYQRHGYEVRRHAGPAADFEIRKADRRLLVSAKRWKASSTGIEPLRALHAAAQAEGVQATVYVTLGPLTDTARQFAAENKIGILQGPGLSQLLRGMTQREQKR